MAVDERPAASAAGSEAAGDGGRMTLVEHLTELRDRLFKTVVAIALGAVVGFVLYDPILEILQDPYCQVSDPCTFLITDPLESFSIRLKIAGYAGLLIASPVVMWQLWRFITPGLYPHEKRYAVPFVASSVVLFLLGAALALWTFPNALDFFVQIGGDRLELNYTPSAYLRLVTFLMLAFGIGFEFPIVLVFLQIAGVLTPARLAGWRRATIVSIFVFVAVITPSGDPFTLLALAGPMYVFYEASIMVGKLLHRRR